MEFFTYNVFRDGPVKLLVHNKLQWMLFSLKEIWFGVGMYSLSIVQFFFIVI